MSDKSLSALSRLFANRRTAISLAIGAILLSSFVYLVRKRQKRLQICVAGDGLSVNLNQAEAAQRAASLSAVTYDIKLNLLETGYKGSWRCSFQLKASGNLWLDFAGKKIIDFRVNQVPSVPLWKDGRVALKGVEVGHNDVEIRFENDYEESGLIATAQMICFLETPGSQHLHHLFPCFDQPDIKATFKLLMTAPRHWQVLSIDFTQSLSNFVGCCPDPDPIYDSEAKQVSALHDFYHSTRCSPEHFAICAGALVQFTVQATNRITIYCRPQVAYKLNLKAQLDVVQNLLAYMKTLTGVPYSFAKLDIVYLPVPNTFAASVIFLNESLLSEDWSDQKSSNDLSEMLVKELISQWIGVVVTYRAYDELPQWRELTATIARHFLSETPLPASQIEALRRVFSLSKWSNCPFSALAA